MLVLTRQINESIMIGDDVEITVVDVRGDKVRIGIRAPRSVAVHRQEVYLAIKKANEEASGSGTEAVDGLARAAALMGPRGSGKP